MLIQMILEAGASELAQLWSLWLDSPKTQLVTGGLFVLAYLKYKLRNVIAYDVPPSRPRRRKRRNYRRRY